jgi:hypothetical protein
MNLVLVMRLVSFRWHSRQFVESSDSFFSPCGNADHDHDDDDESEVDVESGGENENASRLVSRASSSDQFSHTTMLSMPQHRPTASSTLTSTVRVHPTPTSLSPTSTLHHPLPHPNHRHRYDEEMSSSEASFHQNEFLDIDGCGGDGSGARQTMDYFGKLVPATSPESPDGCEGWGESLIDKPRDKNRDKDKDKPRDKDKDKGGDGTEPDPAVSALLLSLQDSKEMLLGRLNSQPSHTPSHSRACLEFRATLNAAEVRTLL